MLKTFRKSAGGIFAKLLLGVLVMSFALWGIGDIFRGVPENTVATVAGEPITGSELQDAIENLQQQYDELTPQMAGSLPFQLQTLQQLVNRRLLEHQAEALGLTFSQDALSARIAADPLFQEEGIFDREQFFTLLRMTGLSQAAFVQRYEQDMQRLLAQAAVTETIFAPRAMAQIYYHVREEQREASLILVDERDISKPDEPDEETLQVFYEQQRERYREPEYRTYRFVYFDAEKIADLFSLEPSEEEIRAYYEAHQADYALPPRREVLPLMFDTELTAQAGFEVLANEADAQGVVEESLIRHFAAASDTVTNSDRLEATRYAEDDLPTGIAAEIFVLEEGQFSRPVETDFGWQIFYLRDIQPADTRPLEEVREQIATILLSERLEKRLHALSNRLDDSLAAGATLEEALEQAGLGALRIETLGPISATNTLKNGETYAMKPVEQEILELAFEQPSGEISPISLSENGQYFVVETLDIIPSAIPPLKEVQSELKTDWMAQQTKQRLLEKARELAGALQLAEHPVVAAKERGLSLHATGRLKRQHDTVSNQSQLKDKILTSDFVQALFALRLNEVSDPYALPSGEYAIGILDAIHEAPAPEEAELAALEAELTLQLQQQALGAYLTALRERFPVELFMERLTQTAER